MQRRGFLLSASAWLAALPLASFAQATRRVWKIGFLAYRPRPISFDTDTTYGEFVRAMRKLGYVEGRNLHIEWRFADSQYERLPGLAAELVRLNPDIIVTHTTPGARAAQGATRTIPIAAAGSATRSAQGWSRALRGPAAT
jgi:putative tryptophan/tyrosine transport system substrate-binding protein